jgi:hypothetical protein
VLVLILIPNLSSGVTIDISGPADVTLVSTAAGAGRTWRIGDVQLVQINWGTDRR